MPRIPNPVCPICQKEFARDRSDLRREHIQKDHTQEELDAYTETVRIADGIAR